MNRRLVRLRQTVVSLRRANLTAARTATTNKWLQVYRSGVTFPFEAQSARVQLISTASPDPRTTAGEPPDAPP